MVTSALLQENQSNTFVCDCEEWMRTACAGEGYYKEREGKRYCVLHYPSKEKAEDFQQGRLQCGHHLRLCHPQSGRRLQLCHLRSGRRLRPCYLRRSRQLRERYIQRLCLLCRVVGKKDIRRSSTTRLSICPF